MVEKKSLKNVLKVNACINNENEHCYILFYWALFKFNLKEKKAT